MVGVPDTIGERWTVARAPHPSTADLMAARRSPEVRARVDRQWAEWLGLPEDEVEGFVRHLADHDARALGVAVVA